ncbi:MAG: hypothetical protein K9G46_01060 [Flavobacteriales bacterium]|nr:hypothetical protein [Flavobacteriales bacterium]
MINRVIFGIFMLLGFSATAQELKLTNTIKGEFDFMTTDHIGRLYLAKGHELFVYYDDGKLKYQYSDLSRGVITHLDTRNPMKLLLFYPGYGQIALLDNTLSRTRDNINLSDFGLELATLACASYDNGFWVYDPVSFQLLRYDQGLKITNEISNINQLVGAEINPNQMVEFENSLYLNDANHGVFVFDSFGTYSKLIPIKGAERIQVRENGVFLEYENKLIKYDPMNFEQAEITLPVKEFKALSIEKKSLYVLQKGQVLVFSLDK